MGGVSKTILDFYKYNERWKKILELRSNPDRKAIRKFVYLREYRCNLDKVFAARTGGQYRQATKTLPLYFAFNDQTFEEWLPTQDGRKWSYNPAYPTKTYLPDEGVDYGTIHMFFEHPDSNKCYKGKDIYEKMLEFSECKDGFATDSNKCPIRIGGDFHEIVPDYLIKKYNLNKDEL